jgi:mono/diheme cytochrome c family protein
LSQAQWYAGTVSDPLGQPKAGLSAELDALAAYVRSLVGFGVSPHRAPDGSLTPAAARGKALFDDAGCASCHSGPGFTDSAFGALHDVGTLGVGSGQANGGALTGLDTPTLRGLWATAPYLHDGSAATLADVVGPRNPTGQHGPTHLMTAAERQDLVAYLLSIDDGDRGCRELGTGEDLQLRSGVGASPDLDCLEEASAGDTVRHVMESPSGVFQGALGAMLYQVHTPAQPPAPTLPGLRLDQVDGVFYAAPLSASGFVVDVPVPPGLAGFVLRAQAVALSVVAQNSAFASSDAHDVFLR